MTRLSIDQRNIIERIFLFSTFIGSSEISWKSWFAVIYPISSLTFLIIFQCAIQPKRLLTSLRAEIETFLLGIMSARRAPERFQLCTLWQKKLWAVQNELSDAMKANCGFPFFADRPFIFFKRDFFGVLVKVTQNQFEKRKCGWASGKRRS